MESKRRWMGDIGDEVGWLVEDVEIGMDWIIEEIVNGDIVVIGVECR
jgi:hypothetical protein